MITTLGVAFVAGIWTFISPCVLPLIPVYVAYFSGVSLGQTKSRDVFLNSLAFVAAFTLVFTLMGATATFIGSWLLHFQRIILVFFSVIMLVMGLHLGGFVRIPFLMREKRLGRIENKGTLLSSFLLGLVFALGWSPCVGPVLASMLILAAEKSTVLKGMGLLFVYSIGLGIPFILSALVLQRSARLLQGIKRHLGLIEKLGGAALVFMALWMIFRGGSL